MFTFWTEIEKRFVYYPEAGLIASPAEFGLEYEDAYFTTSDGSTLHGWYIPGEGETTLLWFHGNGGNISHRLDEAALFHHRLGVNQLLFDYRGYGKSEGKPTEKGTYLDARAALGYLRGRGDLDPERTVYFGRSLGSAVAVELATEHEPVGLVLVAPFTSVSNMAKTVMPLVPLHRLVRGRYDSLERIGGIRCPALILHGEQDRMVPVEHSRQLFEAANSPKQFRVLPGAGHNDTYIAGGAVYWDALGEFLESLGEGTLEP